MEILCFSPYIHRVEAKDDFAHTFLKAIEAVR